MVVLQRKLEACGHHRIGKKQSCKNQLTNIAIDEPAQQTPADAIPLGETCRLSDQGFINRHRKSVFRILAATLVIDLLFAPKLLELPEACVGIFQIGGMILLFMGIIGRTFATLSIGGRKDREIVTTELYSVCRNPLYFASFLMALGLGLLSVRLDFLLGVTLAYLVIFYPMMWNEARFLKERFPDFSEYESRVPLFVPDFRLWCERRHFQADFKLMKRTLLEALIAVPAAILICIIWSLRH
jgi:protein-S-isoprenylcysteine O-methyltransferase Ste14